MELTKEEVRHIAHLARLRLSEEEVEKFSSQLTGILGWIEMLNEVDTEGVEETAQVAGLQNSERADEIGLVPLASRDELLACSELPLERRQVRVPSVL